MGNQKLEKNLDSIDLGIIECLRADSRERWVDIAKKLGTSEATIRFRTNKLIEEGVIKNFTIETALEEPEALVLIKVEPSLASQVLKKIGKTTPEIFETSGDWDAAVKVRKSKTSELNKTVDQIRDIKGVTRTQTLIKLNDLF